MIGSDRNNRFTRDLLKLKINLYSAIKSEDSEALAQSEQPVHSMADRGFRRGGGLEVWGSSLQLVEVIGGEALEKLATEPMKLNSFAYLASNLWSPYVIIIIIIILYYVKRQHKS